MPRPIVKLKLDIKLFDEKAFEGTVSRCKRDGINLESMASLGDTKEHRLQLYQLNKTCSADIPARGKFFSYEEFCKRRYGKGYDPEGVIIALIDCHWVGMSANSNWQKHNFVFNEMTGVQRQNRRQGIALALKLKGIRYAKKLGVEYAYTVHDAENVAPIRMNRKLGYVDADWDNLLD